MIRINLLPFRAARKRENVKRQFTIYVLTTLFTLVVLVYFFFDLSGTLSDLKKEEENVKKELASYRKTIKEINALERKIKEVKTKLSVIGDLEKNKTGPVHLLDELALSIPKDQLWLNSYNEQRGTLTLRGTAKDNETVALFMTNLEKSDYIKTVDLESAIMRPMPEYKTKVSDFVLSCKTYAFKEKKAPTRSQGRGRKR